jgi:hypothetical protein
MAGATSLRGCTSRTHTENTAIPGLSLTLSTVEALDQPIEKQGLAVIEVPRPALSLAGKAFVRYRRFDSQRAEAINLAPATEARGLRSEASPTLN